MADPHGASAALRQPSPGDEAGLIQRSLAGDQDAFRQLVERHYRMVIAAAYRAFGNQAQAEDLAQDVFVKVFQNLPSYRHEQPFIHWLHRITSNAIAGTFRRRRPVLSLDAMIQLPPAPDDPQQTVTEREGLRTLRQAIAALPEVHRSVLMLRAYHDLSYEEIAEVLEIPLGTVMSRLHYAKERLRQALRGSLLDEAARSNAGEVNKG